MTADTLQLGRYLTAYVRRHRRAAAARAAGWAVVVAVTSTLLACSVDRLRPLPSAARGVFLAVVIVGPVALLCRPFVRLTRRRFDVVAAAAAVERRHPAFAHRLLTAVSTGGSAGLRAALDRDVAVALATTGPARVPRRPAVVAWAAAGAAVLAFAGLCRWPWLDLPDLTHRLIRPTAAVAAVTSTRLAIQPGDTSVLQGHPVTITAVVEGTTTTGPVALHVSDDDGRTWATRPMARRGDGPVATVVADADRDLRYFVTAGDAVSPTSAVRVRRVPAVVALRVRLDDRTGVGRPSTINAGSDGLIDAPTGGTATVDVVATVPLRDATLTFGADRVQTTATADPCVRRGAFVVTRDGRLDVRLTAVDGTVGTGPRSMRVHVRQRADGDAPGFADQQRAYRAALDRR